MRLLKDMGTIFKFAGVYFLGKRYPLSVTFLTTYRCNFRCAYCSVWQNKVTELSTKEVFAMIDELSALGLRRLGLNGGEPLLREDIGEIIEYSIKKGITTTLFTNGWLVKDNIEKLKKLDVLLISLDGPAQVHDAQRSPGSYNKVIEAIDAARSHNLNIWTNTVISKNNVAYIEFILDKAKDLGFKTTFQPVYFYTHSSQQEQIDRLLPAESEYRAAVDKIIREKKRGGPVLHSVRYLEYIRNPDWQQNKRRCWAGRFYIAITPDGMVSPCYPIFASYNWPSGRELGYKKASNSIADYKCNGCYCILAENDFFFSLKPDVIFNYFKHIG